MEHKYTPLGDASLSESRHYKRLNFLSICLHIIILSIVGLVGFLVGSHGTLRWTCSDEPSWSPELSEMKRTSVEFDSSVYSQSPFRGPPSPAIDREWDRFSAHHLIDGTASLIAVTIDDIKQSNKVSDPELLNSTVRYQDGTYMASLEMFHQLHCLNMLRKVLHSNYYESMRPLADGSRPYAKAAHLDHCVEMLRQVISCYGDTNLITYHWVKDNPVPWPDFNTWHQCRDPEEILAWSKAREAPIRRLMRKEDYSSIYEMAQPP